MVPQKTQRSQGCPAPVPGTSLRSAALGVVVLALLAVAGRLDAARLTLPHVEGAPGETVRLSVYLDDVAPDSILSGNIDIGYDAAILTHDQVSVDRRGALAGTWSMASNARQRPGGAATDGQLLIATATATDAVTADGVLFYLDVVVAETAQVGQTARLHFASVLLNNGEPVAEMVEGSLTVIAPRIHADFSGFPQTGMVPLEVQFQDLSSGEITAWEWSFGDGDTSTEAEPRHAYLEAGDYAVTLTVSGAGGQDAETKTDYIHVSADVQPPVIVEGPIARGVGHNAASIYWRTDEPGNSEVVYCALRFRPVWGNVQEVIAGLADELDESDAAAAEALERGEAAHFDELGAADPALAFTCDRVVDDELTTTHQMRLTGLSPFTFYIYRVRSTDGDGNSSAWRGGFFVTHNRPDDEPPHILLGPHVTAAPTRALVYWVTDEPSSSFVQYSLQSDYSDGSRINSAALVARHEVWLEDLSPGTTYYYRVRSTDESGNSSTLKAGRFRTPLADGDAPQILSGPRVVRRSATKALIWWRTDEASTSRVEYGLSESYGRSVSEDDLVQGHQLFLSHLEPQTVYHFRVVSADASGNETASDDETFVTGGTADTRPPGLVRRPYLIRRHHDRLTFGIELDEECRGRVEFGPTADYGSVLELGDFRRLHSVTLGGLTPATEYHCRVHLIDVEGNGPLTSEDFTLSTAPDQDSAAPVIEGGPWIRNRTDASVTVAWRTDEASDSFVDFGADAGYGATAGNPDHVREHVVTLTNLEPSTTYHLQAYSNDPDGNGPTYSGDLVVETRPEPDRRRPRFLSGPEVIARTATSAIIEWLTDEATDTFVDYGATISYGRETASDEFGRRHRVVLPSLSPDTDYHYRVSASDRAGNEPVVSRDLVFRTRAGVDDQPPRVRRLAVRKVTSTSALLEWRTDEPTDGFVDYGPEDDYGYQAGNSDLGRRHQVLIGDLEPGREYSYRVRSTDLAGNETRSRKRTWRTRAGRDERAPTVIEGPQVVVSNATATLAWRTDEPCFGTVVVGADGDLGTGGEELYEGERATTDHRVTVTGLVAGTRYYFALVSRDLGGNESVLGNRRRGAGKIIGPLAEGGEISFTTEVDADLEAPVFVTPAQVLAAGDDEVVIGWTTDEVSDGRIYLVDEGEETVVQYEASHDFEHRLTVGGLQAATTYTVVAASTDPSGNGPAQSQPLTFTTTARGDEAAPRLTSLPEIWPLGEGRVSVAWSTDEIATATVLYGQQDMDLEAVSVELATQHRVELTNLTPGATYTGQVEVTDAFGNGPTSSQEFELIAPAADAAAPRIDADPVVAQISDRGATITWSTDEPSDGYVEYGTGGTLDRSLGRATLERDHAVELTHLEPGQTYTFRVVSVDASGNGPTSSAQAAFTTLAGADAQPPAAPGAVAAQLTYGGGVRVSWTPPADTDVTGYRVYRAIDDGEYAAIAGPVTAPHYIDLGQTAGGVLQYRVTALDGAEPANESAYSTGASLSVAARPGDFHADGVVDFTDFFLLADHFGRSEAEAGFDALYDFSGNGLVDFDDFFIFVDLYGTDYGLDAAAGRPVPLDAPLPFEVELSAEPAALGDGYAVTVHTPDGAGLRAFGLQLEYGAAAAELTAAEVGSGLAGSGADLVAVFADQPGELALGGLQGDAPLTGPAVLARLHFAVSGRAGQVRVTEVSALREDGSRWRHRPAAGTLQVDLRPTRFALLQNFPNPFNPATEIRYLLPEGAPVSLRIFDVLGQQVAQLVGPEATQTAGMHRVIWHGRDSAGRAVASGIYFCALESTGFRQVRKLLLVR